MATFADSPNIASDSPKVLRHTSLRNKIDLRTLLEYGKHDLNIRTCSIHLPAQRQSAGERVANSSRSICFDQRLDNRVHAPNTNKTSSKQSSKA